MKASDFVRQQLLGEHEPYGSRYQSQQRHSITVRLPIEMVAWIDLLKMKGLSDTRSGVIMVLLDLAIEQVTDLGVFGDGSDLSDIVDELLLDARVQSDEGGQQ